MRTGPARPGADTREVARDWDIPELVTDRVRTPAETAAGTPAEGNATTTATTTETTSVTTPVKDFPHQGD